MVTVAGDFSCVGVNCFPPATAALNPMDWLTFRTLGLAVVALATLRFCWCCCKPKKREIRQVERKPVEQAVHTVKKVGKAARAAHATYQQAKQAYRWTKGAYRAARDLGRMGRG